MSLINNFSLTKNQSLVKKVTDKPCHWQTTRRWNNQSVMDNPWLIKNQSLISNRSLINKPSLTNNQSLTKEPILSSHFPSLSWQISWLVPLNVSLFTISCTVLLCALLKTVALCSRNNITNMRLPCKTCIQQWHRTINLLRKEPAVTPLQLIVNKASIINDVSDPFTATTN